MEWHDSIQSKECSNTGEYGRKPGLIIYARISHLHQYRVNYKLLRIFENKSCSLCGTVYRRSVFYKFEF